MDVVCVYYELFGYRFFIVMPEEVLAFEVTSGVFALLLVGRREDFKFYFRLHFSLLWLAC
jgi:hypothetical protein